MSSISIGISYPAASKFHAFELKQCENCPDLFTRAVGSLVKFCGRCIADHLAHPIPWAKGSLAAYMNAGEEDITVKRYTRKSKVASKACRTAQHWLCSKLDCACPCHRKNA